MIWNRSGAFFVQIIFCCLVCPSFAAGQEGQDKSDTRDRDLPGKNPYDSPADLATGRQYFLGHCAQCHGPDGEGGRGVNLTTGRYRHGSSDRQLYMTIRKGVPGSEMYGSSLSPPELWKVVPYFKPLRSSAADTNAPRAPKAHHAI